MSRRWLLAVAAGLLSLWLIAWLLIAWQGAGLAADALIAAFERDDPAALEARVAWPVLRQELVQTLESQLEDAGRASALVARWANAEGVAALVALRQRHLGAQPVTDWIAARGFSAPWRYTLTVQRPGTGFLGTAGTVSLAPQRLMPLPADWRVTGLTAPTFLVRQLPP